MDPLLIVLVALAVLSLLLFTGLVLQSRTIRRLRTGLTELESRKRSQSTRYGQITEQFAPFMAAWPWDPKRFRFLGDPIDGIQFTDDGIILVEIKSSRSRLSPVQRQVRDHVQASRVAWQEVRIDA